MIENTKSFLLFQEHELLAARVVAKYLLIIKPSISLHLRKNVLLGNRESFQPDF